METLMKLKKKSVSLLMVISLAFTLTSCDMADNAEKASENSGKAAKAAGDSREEIANSRLMSRSAGASASRRKALDGVMKMSSISMKVTEASKYVKAFEFQLWTGQRYDTKALRDRMYEDAMSELFRSIEELYGKPIAGESLSPFKAKRKAKNRNMNVYALAVSMHGVHHLQDISTTNKNYSGKDSIYSIIKSSLKSIAKVESGEQTFAALKDHEVVVYNYKQEALALIQARYNMLLTMNIAKVSELKKSTLSGLKLIYTKRSFKSKITTLNLGEQAEANKYLNTALKVKTFMNEINEAMIINSKLAKLYSKMRINESEDDESILTKSSEKQQSYKNISEHKRLLEKLEL